LENKRLVIVGTAHVSPKSIRDVEETIEKEMPDAVAIELDERRFLALTKDIKQDIPIMDIIKRGETHLLLFQLLLSYFQKKIGDTYGVKPGDEMLAAFRKAKEINADIILIDRDISITLKRFWTSLSFFEKLKLVGHLIMDFIRKEEVELDEMLEEDVLDMLVKEFRDIAPSAANVLIDERDAYMSSNLLKSMHKYDKVVAVVGAGHKRGIEKYMLNPESIPDVKALEEVKKSGFNVFKLFSYTVFAAIILIFIMLFMTLNSELIVRAFIYWFLINGVLSAIGAAIARGHPFSISSAFLFAWFTSLNPAIAAGWVSGAVEAWVRKPTANDLREISHAESLKDVFRNKFFRVLLVAALTNVGSMLGTFLGAYYVLQMTGIDITSTLKENFGNMIASIMGSI
jgi:pheromone shutdown-related protein TraB